MPDDDLPLGDINLDKELEFDDDEGGGESSTGGTGGGVQTTTEIPPAPEVPIYEPDVPDLPPSNLDFLDSSKPSDSLSPTDSPNNGGGNNSGLGGSPWAYGTIGVTMLIGIGLLASD